MNIIELTFFRSYVYNKQNPSQVLGCLAVRIARTWITSQFTNDTSLIGPCDVIPEGLREPKIRGSQLSVTGFCL